MPTADVKPPYCLQTSEAAQALAASGPPPLWIVEVHVGVHDSALLRVVKGIQVVAGKSDVADAGG